MFIFPDKDNTFILITLIVILLMSYLMINLIDVTDSEIKKKIQAQKTNKIYNDSHLEYYCNVCDFYVQE